MSNRKTGTVLLRYEWRRKFQMIAWKLERRRVRSMPACDALYTSRWQIWNISDVKTHLKRKYTRAHKCANKRQGGSFIQSSVRRGQRTSACVFERWKTERPHIRQGQKGYINTLYDYVSALISVPSPGEERGFCWSAAMTPLWLVLPNTFYQLNRRRSTVSLALLCAEHRSVLPGKRFSCPLHGLCQCALAHLDLWVCSHHEKGQNTPTHSCKQVKTHAVCTGKERQIVWHRYLEKRLFFFFRKTVSELLFTVYWLTLSLNLNVHCVCVNV